MIEDEEIKTTGFNNTESRKSFFDSIQQASMQLDSVKTNFTESMQELARIQSMLDSEGVSKMTGVIEEYENRISAVERERSEAQEGAKRFSAELEKEKDRLIKLWEAYKSQEEELAAQEKRCVMLEESLHQSETERKNFEEDANTRINTLNGKLQEKEQEANEYQAYKHKAEEYENMHNDLQEQNKNMYNDNQAKDGRINELENKVEELKNLEGYVEYKAKYEELYNEYEKEKQRLTKLFQLYEETETENKKLKKEITNWQDWFNTNEDLFKKLFSSVETLKTATYDTKTKPNTYTDTNNDFTLTDDTANAPMDNPIRPEPEMSRKPKKKLKLRK